MKTKVFNNKPIVRRMVVDIDNAKATLDQIHKHIATGEFDDDTPNHVIDVLNSIEVLRRNVTLLTPNHEL